MKDMILVGMEKWDDMWRRTQNLASRLASRYPENKILFIESYQDPLNLARNLRLKDAVKAVSPEPPRALSDFPNIFVFQPSVMFPDSIPAGRSLNNNRIRKQILDAAETLGMTDYYLWVKPYYAHHLIGSMNEYASIYDVGDDWAAFCAGTPEEPMVRQQDEDATVRADAVNVVSSYLMKSKSIFRKDINLIPNGVDTESYSKIIDNTVVSDKVSENWNKPVIGYTGTLHSSRVNVEIIVALADEFPDGTIALVGPCMLDESDYNILSVKPNIVFTGPVKYSRLPSIMSSFNVCFVPNQINEFTESQNPLKMFEYFASGLPVVSTPISGFRDYPDLVYLADNPKDFVRATKEALKEDGSKAMLRLEAVKGASWDDRVDQVVSVLDSLGLK